MTKLIVGLGNPGKKYQRTRHNIGFRVIDALANGAKFKLDKKMEIEILPLTLYPSPAGRGVGDGGIKILLAKPQTFMNNSGIAVQELIADCRFQISDLLVVHDEIDLPFGTIRLSRNKASAGHKGVESIIDKVGQNFTRLRIGVDNRKKRNEIDTEKYVLRNFTKKEEKGLEKTVLPKAVSNVREFLMSNY